MLHAQDGLISSLFYVPMIEWLGGHTSTAGEHAYHEDSKGHDKGHISLGRAEAQEERPLILPP
jgi:hypothetical protein